MTRFSPRNSSAPSDRSADEGPGSGAGVPDRESEAGNGPGESGPAATLVPGAAPLEPTLPLTERGPSREVPATVGPALARAVVPSPPTLSPDRAEPEAATAPTPETFLSPLPPAMDEGGPASLESAVPGYELLGELGRGGMGVVYKARQMGLNRVVALKMILSGAHAGGEHVQRFRAEAEAVARLRHPNIVQVHDMGEADGKPFFSLEFVDGGSLAARLGGTPLPPRAAAQLVETLARTMHYAHQQGIVHRDLKPANILLASGGCEPPGKCEAASGGSWVTPGQLPGGSHPPLAGFVPKITDFGLAKRLEGEAGQTHSGTILGTPSYMAPEQAAGKIHEVGPAADTYALGAILYELLTGRPPFKAATVLDTLSQVLNEEPVPPSRLQAKVPRDLQTICLKCLHKEARKRYASALALADDLRRWLNDEPIVARPASVLERSVKWARRRPTAAALLGLSVLAVAALAVGVWSHNEQVKATRAADLVASLAHIDTEGVPHVVAQLDDYRRWADPLLRRALAEAPADSRRRLHASLALLPADDTQRDYLAGHLPKARPEEVGVLRDALAPHRRQIAPRLWAVLENDRADAGQRLRVACALARYEPDDPRWAQVGPVVAACLVAENPLVVGRWTEALRPVRAALVRPLTGIFRDADRPEAERSLAASLLADYAADRPDVLTDVLLDAAPSLFPLLFAPLEEQSDRAVVLLRKELARPLPAASEAERDALAKRQAHAAATLLRLGQAEAVWPLLRHDPDPRRRTYLIHCLAALRAGPDALVQRLETEPDVSARRALLLSLGEFPAVQWPEAERQRLAARLLAAYRDDPDPGIHSATDWLLRRWGHGPALREVDTALAAGVPAKAGRPLRGRRWYVNGQGHTLALVPGPAEFLMGSPGHDPDRFESEVLHGKRIPRSFAIASKEVTLAQFLRFRPGHVYSKKYSPSPDAPATNVTWYEAAAYCRWLSEQEGIPEDQMCYPPVDQIKKGMTLPANYLSRRGYRLPTEAEWEYACRAGAVTRRFYGDADELLDHYAWYLSNARDRVWPVGLKKPNDFGLFDVYGNVWENCQDPWSGEPHRPAPQGQASEDREFAPDPSDRERHRHVRGGSFAYPASAARSPHRQAYLPSVRNNPVGLRVARTLD